MQKYFNLIKENWKAALTVALVNLPLSIALAIASGATPMQGIITAIWAGLIGASFGGSHFNIIGPTGALSGILITYSLANGYAGLPFIAILSGIFMLIAFLFRLDRFIIFIPRSVVHGFTLGVAFIIGLGQLDNALGLTNIKKTDNIIENLLIIFKHVNEFQWIVFLIFVIGTIFIFTWNKKFVKFPGAIMLAAFGILFSWLISNDLIQGIHLNTLAQKYPDIKAGFYINIWKDFSWQMFSNRELWIVSLITAVIGILETLLSGQIAENMTKVKFNRKKELLGLGLANIVTGLCGGIPATAALARTSLNIKSNATHKTSAMLNSLFLVLIMFLLLPFFKWLPMVVIASILVFVAISMVENEHFIYLYKNERTAFILSIFVALITFTEDPIIGILIGTAIALIIYVNNISKGQTEILIWKNGQLIESLLKDKFIKKQEQISDLLVYKISGALTYINMPAHIETAELIKGNKYVIVSLRHAFYLDSDGVYYLQKFIEILKKNNEKIILSGLNPIIEQRLKYEGFYQHKLVEGKIYNRTSDAIKDIYGK